MDIPETWMQIGALFLANFGIILWFRAESRSDWRHMDLKTDAIRLEIKEFNEKWHAETKDFHGKLIALEERSRGLHEKREYKPRTKKPIPAAINPDN